MVTAAVQPDCGRRNLALFVSSAAAVPINGAIVVTDGALCLTGNFGRGLDTGGLPKAQKGEHKDDRNQ
jgi:hypothetical protein